MNAVIFDMDGVLIDSMPFWKESMRRAVTNAGSEFTEALWSEVVGLRLDETLEKWHKEIPWNEYTTDEVEKAVLDGVVSMIEQKGEPKRGVYSALDAISSRGIPIALASSSYAVVIEATLERLGIRDRFQVVHSAEKEQYGKPHPAVYLTTASMLELAPSECTVVEDSLNGIISAKAAKMRCIAVPEGDLINQPEVQIADAVISSLEQFDIRLLGR